MASQLISFRLTDAEVEALKAQALPDESLNLTAKRLLKETGTLSTIVDNAVDKSRGLTARIEAIVVAKTEFVVEGLNAKLAEFESKLGKL